MSVSAVGKTKPRVSVFVPSYNHAPFIEQCLKSVFNQTLSPDELLIIDDGSTDDSPAVIEKLLKECSFPCELIVRPNKGLCVTLNEGFEKTGGDYFAYLGSDDLWLPEFLAARVELLESSPNSVLAHGNAYTIDENSNIFETSEDWNTYIDDDARPLLNRALAPISSTVCYRRSALAKHRWNENSRLEDFELYLYLSYDGTFAFDRRVLSAWRMHDRNASRNLNMMLEESIAAHHRVANSLELNKKDLDRAATETSLEYALLFARRRHKSKALSLLLQNWIKAPTLKMPVKILGHCLLPVSLKKIIDERKKQTADNRFKSVSFDNR